MSSSSSTPTPLSGRPLAGTELSWFRAVPGGTGISLLTLLLSHPLPLSSLNSTLHHPILLSSLSNPFFSIPPTPNLHLRSSSAPDLHSVLELELNLNPWATPSPSEPTPVFFATLYELPCGRAALSLRAHTSVCDRTSSLALLKGIVGELSGERVKIEGKVNNGLEDSIPKEDSWKPFWARGKDLIGYSVNGLRTSNLRFMDTASDRRSEIVRLTMSRDETRRVLEECEKREIKLCGAMAAAAMIAAHSSKHFDNVQKETYSLVTLIDCRRNLKPALDDNDIGFYHSAIINTHSIQGGEDVWEVASRCHSSYFTAKNNKKHLKDIGELNYLMEKAIDNPHLTPSSSLRTALISVFEETKIDDSCGMLKELGIEDYVVCSSVHGVGPSIAVFDTIRDGKLDCAFVYPSPLHSRKQITELVEQMKRLLIESEELSS